MPRWISLAEADRLTQAMREEHGPAKAEELALRLWPLIKNRHESSTATCDNRGGHDADHV